ncbi:MAG: winged helix-turn-helix domain-containing protein [Acidimicrobiales bacterium]
MAPLILFIEDDERIRTVLRISLEHDGFAVIEAPSGEEGLAQFERRPPDVVLVDLRLPGIDGFEVTRILRRSSNIPIIMVTAHGDSHDTVAGLEAGADDYVVKPVVAKVLAARIRALLRRASSEEETATVVRVGDVEIHREANLVTRDGQEVPLTRTEFKVLCALAEHPGWVLSRAQLLESVWEYDFFGDDRLVDTHVGRLRAKIEHDPSKPELIVTVRGVGYKLQT